MIFGEIPIALFVTLIIALLVTVICIVLSIAEDQHDKKFYSWHYSIRRQSKPKYTKLETFVYENNIDPFYITGLSIFITVILLLIAMLGPVSVNRELNQKVILYEMLTTEDGSLKTEFFYEDAVEYNKWLANMKYNAEHHKLFTFYGKEKIDKFDYIIFKENKIWDP